MARDDLEFKRVNQPSRSRTVVSTGSTSHSGIGTAVYYRSQRSDSNPTMPTRDGVFFRATAYGAFRASANVTAGECYWKRVSALNPNSFTLYRDFWESHYLPHVPQLTPWHLMFADPGTGEPQVSTACIAAARNSVLSQAKGVDFNALQQIGELRETVNMLISLAELVANRRKALDNLLESIGFPPKYQLTSSLHSDRFMEDIARRGGHLSRTANDFGRYVRANLRDNAIVDRARDAANRRARNNRLSIPSRIASAYLGYIFGVAPLINASFQLADAITYQLEKTIATVVANVVDSDFGIGKGKLTPTNDWKFSGIAKMGVRCQMLFQVRSPELFEAWRFGLLNPATALWELTPFSFIADWFTGLGSFLSALDSGIAIRNLDNSESHYLDLRLKADFRAFQPANSREIFVSGSEWKSHEITQKSFRRWLSPVPPIPPVYIRMGLNWSKITSILAIIVSNLSFPGDHTIVDGRQAFRL